MSLYCGCLVFVHVRVLLQFLNDFVETPLCGVFLWFLLLKLLAFKCFWLLVSSVLLLY